MEFSSQNFVSFGPQVIFFYLTWGFIRNKNNNNNNYYYYYYLLFLFKLRNKLTSNNILIHGDAPVFI